MGILTICSLNKSNAFSSIVYEDAENWLDRNQIPVNQSNVGYQRK